MSTDFRILLGGSYNTRVIAPNTSASMSGVVGVGIVGIMIVGFTGTSATKDQRFVNCFTETVINPFGNTKTLYLVKRPGFASALTPQAGSIGNAILIWTGSGNKIISAFGATNSSIYDSETRLVTNNADTTTITGKARSITETVISAVATVVIASTDNSAWYYQPTGTVTKVTDADYPGNAALTTVGGFAHLDGFAFIMTSDGRIWHSNLNSISDWMAQSVIPTHSYPDLGVGVVRHGDKIVGFGTESTEFFANAGNRAGSVLSRVEPLTLKIGCISADAVAEVDNTLYWIGSSPEGGLRVYAYTTSLSAISTGEINTVLLLVGAGNISMTSIKFFGRSFLVILAGTVTFAYCIEEKAWHEWSGTGIPWYKAVGVSSGTQQVNYSISKHSTTGKVFVVDPITLTFQDNGEPYSMFVQTAKVGNGPRTNWEMVEIVADQHPTTSELTVSVSDDDYQTYRTLGVVDLASVRPRIHRCGSASRRAWCLTHSANTPARLEALIGRKSEAHH